MTVEVVKTYECLCAWALYRLGASIDDPRYREAAERSIEAGLRKQCANGWFADNCLDTPDAPLSHTVGYTLQGVLEVGLLTGRTDFMDAARLGLDGVLGQLAPSGFLPGRFYADWVPAALSSCLTGSAQIAHVSYRMAQVSGELRYREAADRITDYLKGLQLMDCEDPGVRGALAGSFPILGSYMRAGYPNWATKYFLDAVMEQDRWNREESERGCARQPGGSQRGANGSRPEFACLWRAVNGRLFRAERLEWDTKLSTNLNKTVRMRPVSGERGRVQLHLAAGEVCRAIQSARALVAESPTVQTMRFLRGAFDVGDDAAGVLKPLKVALLSSFSIEFVRDSLVALGYLSGLRLSLYQPGFAQFHQEISDPDSGLYRFGPDAVILALEGEDLLPRLYGEFLTSGGAEAETVSAELTSLITRFRERSKAMLLVHNFAPVRWPELGVIDTERPDGQDATIRRLNDTLVAAADATQGVHVLDYAGLVARHGALNWYDQRMKLYARQPIAASMLPALAREHIKCLRALAGGAKKCLVVDLDNTVWGGVVGEDGVPGLHIGTEYPGSAFLAFQRAVLGLRQRGVLIAVASKNNPEDALQVFRERREMLLQPEHFAAIEIGWAPKSESVRAIAAALNIGLDQIVLVDDNPAECAEVSQALPMVTTLTLPPRPEQFVQALMEEGWFDTLAFSDEDRRRAELYQQRAAAEAARSSATSLEDYFRSLEMVFEVSRVTRLSLPRAAQLTQKTNQFNVTTIRYSEAEIQARIEDPNWIVAVHSVTDKFGDNGIIGMAMAHVVDGVAELEHIPHELSGDQSRRRDSHAGACVR